MSQREDQRTEDAIARARTIAGRIAQREDRRAQGAIEAFERQRAAARRPALADAAEPHAVI